MCEYGELSLSEKAPPAAAPAVGELFCCALRCLRQRKKSRAQRRAAPVAAPTPMPANAPDERPSPPFPPLLLLLLLLEPVSVLEAAAASESTSLGLSDSFPSSVAVDAGAEGMEAGGRGAVNVDVTWTVLAAFR